MKKITKTLVLAAMIVPGVMQAQHGFKVGAKLGLNMANVVDTYSANKSKLGLHVGPTLHYGFGDEGRFAIGLDLLYSQKGSKSDRYSEDLSLKPYSLSYLDVPLYFRYRFGFGLYLETGVDVGLLMSAKYDGKSEREETITTTTYNNAGDPVTVMSTNKVKIKDETKGVDVGYLFGLGYIHRSGFGIGYRYNLGLTNLNKGSIFDENYAGTGIALNTVGQISAMYYFKWSDGGGRGKKKRGHRRR
ncbi:MAG: porin family protein [Flavobacteriales bacterium]